MNDPAARPGRTPEQIRVHGNRLAAEGSLYLRQHGHNPIDWYPWGEEALTRARVEDRPIFLSIGYSSCHWCHVMEHEVFEQDDVAAYVNDHFICIKVDREERPDLDAVYMDAVQAMTGRGGWPMSVFLTPGLQPFWGGTYVPHDPFLELCKSVTMIFGQRRQELEQQAFEVAQHVNRVPEPGGGPVDLAQVESVAEQCLQAYDPEWGGFRQSQKFPTPLRWRFLLHEHRRTGREDLGAAVRHTLDAMASGGLRDQLGGGFHRYTTERTWLVPHFEIMLYDNAQLASLYLEAGAAFAEPRYRRVGLDVLDFLLRDLEDPDGGFHASYDADSGGEEGTFYVWTPEEIHAVAGDDGPALCRLLGVTTQGNFEGRSILTRRVEPRDEGEAGLVDRWREPLRRARAERTPPGRDEKIVTAWNGLALGALARGYAVSGDVRYREAADRAVRRLRRDHVDASGRLVRASTGGTAAGGGVLDDYAFLADGLLDLHDATGDLAPLAWAIELLDRARELFLDEDGDAHLTPEDAATPLGRRREFFDSVEPSGASALAHALLRLGALRGEPRTTALADTLLMRYGHLLERAGLEMAWWADALLLRAMPLAGVVLAGDPRAADTQALLEAYREAAPFHTVLTRVPAGGPGPDLLAAAPPTRDKTARNGRAAAYVCVDGACGAPVLEPKALRENLLGGDRA